MAIPQIACATTATAASFSPCNHPACPTEPPSAAMPYPNRIIANADGAVKPIYAVIAPLIPDRDSPIAIPTWLLAGPGKNWHSATRSAYAFSSSQRRRTTNSSRKYPRCATGPPNEVRPSFRKERKTVPAETADGQPMGGHCTAADNAMPLLGTGSEFLRSGKTLRSIVVGFAPAVYPPALYARHSASASPTRDRWRGSQPRRRSANTPDTS